MKSPVAARVDLSAAVARGGAVDSRQHADGDIRRRASSGLKASGWVAALMVAVAGMVLLAAAARTPFDHPPNYDEFYHALAARGIVEHGEPRIADGLYPRGELFTIVVAKSYAVLGDSMRSARVPALLCGLLLVALVGAWIVRRAGLVAGVVCVVVLALSPLTVDMSVFARFYTMHALATAVMSIAVFEALTPARSLAARLGLIALAAGSALVGAQLHAATPVAVASVAAAAVAVFVLDRWNQLRASVLMHTQRWAVGIVLLAIIALAVAWYVDVVGALRDPPVPVAAATADSVNLYNSRLRAQTPLLWPLLPAASLLALTAHRRVAVFCITFSVLMLGVHSIAAQKAMRYVFCILPFICAIWGLGVAVAVDWLDRTLREHIPRVAQRSTAVALLLLVLTFVNSAEGSRGVKLALGRATLAEFSSFARESDWELAAPTLAPLVPRASTVIVSAGVKALYSLGRYDYEINFRNVLQSETGAEFGRDARTGREVISTPPSLATLLNLPGADLVVADTDMVGQPGFVSQSVVDLIEQRCAPVSVPVESRVTAWWCS